MSRLVIRVSRLVLTLFSYPAYECTTNQSPGANRSAARRAATGSDSSLSPSNVATAVVTSVAAPAPRVASAADGASAPVTSSEISSYSGTVLPSLLWSLGRSAGEHVSNHPGEPV